MWFGPAVSKVSQALVTRHLPRQGIGERGPSAPCWHTVPLPEATRPFGLPVIHYRFPRFLRRLVTINVRRPSPDSGQLATLGLPCFPVCVLYLARHRRVDTVLCHRV
jgi:hypothetical protein